MTGSLYEKHGKFYAVTNEIISGKRVRKWIPTGITTERGNKRKAQEAFNRIMAESGNSNDIEYSDVEFADYLVDWLDSEHKHNIELITYEGYKIYLNIHLYPYYKRLGVKLTELRPQHIQSYVSEKFNGGLSASSVKKHRFSTLLCRKGLNHIRYHDLRHTAASILVSLGMNVKEVSAFLGHNQVSTTLDIYAHLFDDGKAAVASKLGEALTM